MTKLPPMDLEDDDLCACQWCDGKFLLEDMDGEHCRECAQEIFGDDA